MLNDLTIRGDDVARIKALATTHHYLKNSVIFSEGDTANKMYVIESGRVSIQIQEFTQQEDICCLGPGEYLGEMAFFYGDKRSASAVAGEDSVLYRIDRTSFLALYENDNEFAARIDRMVAGNRIGAEWLRSLAAARHCASKGHRREGAKKIGICISLLCGRHRSGNRIEQQL